MKSFLILATFCLALFIFSNAHARIRCGYKEIISIGDTKMEVTMKLKECGKIMEKESYSKWTHYQGQRIETTIEEWYILVRERGGNYCYPLTFEYSKLKTVGRWTKCK